MGTHPIFESDFDCLTEMNNSRSPKVDILQLGDETVHVASMSFADCEMLAVSDTGTFGSFYHVDQQKGAHENLEPLVSITPIFGLDDQYFQVVCRHLGSNLGVSKRL